METKEKKVGVALPPSCGMAPSIDVAEAMVGRYARELFELKEQRTPLTPEQRKRMPELRYAARVWSRLLAPCVLAVVMSGCGAGVGFNHSLTLHRVDEMQVTQRTYRADNDKGVSCLWLDCEKPKNVQEVVYGK